VSATSSATKLWLFLGCILLPAALYLGADWSAKKYVERWVRARKREHPEHADDLDEFLRRSRVRRSLREWYHDQWRLQEISPPPRMAVDHKALPILLSVVIIFVAALAAQAAFDSPVASWIGFAGWPVVAVCGLWALAPVSKSRRRRGRPR
jgi:hypothetical protein